MHRYLFFSRPARPGLATRRSSAALGRPGRFGLSFAATSVALVLLSACGSGTPTPLPQATALPPSSTLAAAQTGVPTQPSPTARGTAQTDVPTPIPPVAAPTQSSTAAPSGNPSPAASSASDAPLTYALREFDVPAGAHPHDVAPAADGGIWYTAQAQGALGHLDIKTGATRQIPLGNHSAPHGVILGPDGAPWITDGGQNAIVRVDPATEQVQVFPLPNPGRNVNLNTATFDKEGILWFTGQGGVYGKLDPKTGKFQVWDAPRGAGPYGITTTPDGQVYYASLAGSYVGHINTQTGEVTVLEPPTPRQGARRVWSDSRGRIWVSEWNAGQVAVYDPANNSWREWKLPGARPQAYAVYVDENDTVWLSDFGANALVQFDPETETFQSYPLPSASGSVRQILGRAGQVWAAESGADKLILAQAE